MSCLLLLPRCHSGPGCRYPWALATRLYSPLLPAAPKAAVVPVVPCWGLQGTGDGVISLGALSHYRPEGSWLSEALPPSSFASFLCLSQLWGPARQPLAVVVAARLAVSLWDSFRCLHKPTASVLSVGENRGPVVVGRVAGGSVQSHQKPRAGCGMFLSGPGLGVAPAHPRGACVGCGGAAAARPCLWEAVAILLAPPLSKTPSMLQRAPHPSKSLNPQVLPLKVVATLEQGRCCWEMVPLGVGRGISGHAGAAPRSRNRGRSSAGDRHRCLAPSHGLSLSSFFMASPGKAPGMKSNRSACVLACRVQSSVKFFSHPWELQLDVEGPRSWRCCLAVWRVPRLGLFPSRGHRAGFYGRSRPVRIFPR